jgi:Cu(I)/Ag(I) efflux system membrane fusion protein
MFIGRYECNLDSDWWNMDLSVALGLWFDFLHYHYWYPVWQAAFQIGGIIPDPFWKGHILIMRNFLYKFGVLKFIINPFKSKKMRKLIFLFAAIIFMSANSSCSNSSKSEQVAAEGEKQATLVVQGSCGMCKKRIEKAATEVGGAITASWDAEAKKLEFQYDASKTSPEAISKAIANVGYDTELNKASEETYDALPGCCHYRESEES